VARPDAPREAPPEPGGLAPAEARDWIALQRALAWHPESIAERVRAGEPPDRILATADPRRVRLPDRATVDRDVARLERLGARVVPLAHPDYPPALAALVDAPTVLLVRGRVGVLLAPAVAIVGARAATHAALDAARRLARELAVAGLTIVSGLARGIDAAAHRGALEGGGPTIGVMACGPERIYPPEHRRLAADMQGAGAIVSELPLDASPRRIHFPLRNRIISGLCRAVVVVEARVRSGSLITARHALDQGREVFAVPGSIEGPFAGGTNRLLRDGARPVLGAQDVLEDLGLATAPSPVASAPDARPTLRLGEPGSPRTRVLGALETGPLPRDELTRGAGLEAGALAMALLELELEGRVVEDRDGRIHAIRV
jgi:DNA processing protein